MLDVPKGKLHRELEARAGAKHRRRRSRTNTFEFVAISNLFYMFDTPADYGSNLIYLRSFYHFHHVAETSDDILKTKRIPVHL